LHLTGDVRDRGFAEGYLCGPAIRACFEEFALGHVVGGRARAWDLIVLPAVRQRFEFPERTRLWAEAVAVGLRAEAASNPSGGKLRGLGRTLTTDDLLACAAIPDLAGFLCSSFAAYGPATKSGDVLVARNLDYPSTPAVERHSMVFVHAPDGARAGWIGVGWPGSPGCLTGLSDRGVFVAIHDVHSGPLRGEGRITPRVLAQQELIEELVPSESIAEDALARLRTRRYSMGGNVMLAWQSTDPGGARGAAVLELDGNTELESGVTLRLPTPDTTWIACSNHHRVRSDDGHACNRYESLVRGAAEGGLDRDGAWRVIDSSRMRITLYRCVADLGTRTLEVERHTDVGWQPRVMLGWGNAADVSVE